MGAFFFGFLGMAIGQGAPKQTPQLSYYEKSEIEYAVYGYVRAMDRGDFDSVWKKTSPIGRQRLNEADWVKLASRIRHTFGDYESRKEVAIGTVDEITDGTKCRCAGVDFRAGFSLLAADEKVIVSFEDGQWKLAGYFLKGESSK